MRQCWLFAAALAFVAVVAGAPRRAPNAPSSVDAAAARNQSSNDIFYTRLPHVSRDRKDAGTSTTITGHIYCDNRFEFWFNGKLVKKDPLTFTVRACCWCCSSLLLACLLLVACYTCCCLA